MINFKNIKIKHFFTAIAGVLALALTAMQVVHALEPLAPSHDEGEAGQSQRYHQLKAYIFAKPYEQLPYYKVTKSLFNSKTDSSKSYLLSDAQRTLRETHDLLGPERGQKLLQANGICFAATWQIDQASEYSGLFRQGSHTPAIVRISTSFSGTKQKERRALGMAVKLLPNDLGAEPSLNVFALHTVGGLKTKFLLDVSMDNEPSLGRIPRLSDISTALKLKSVLLKADKEAGSEEPSITFRTIQPLAAYQGNTVAQADGSLNIPADGSLNSSASKTSNPTAATLSPKWIRFTPATQARVDKQDFRDEFRVENYPNGELVYQIDVASGNAKKKSKAQWEAIGKLVLTESVTSNACDTQLHFAHPKN